MLSAKEQKAFEKLAETLNGKITPKMGEVIEKFLKKQGIDKQVKPFFLECFEELENKIKVWPISTDKVQKVLECIPDNWKTSVITDDLVAQRIPEKDWSKYRDSNWVKQHTKMKEAASSVAIAAGDPSVSIVREKYDTQQGKLVYEITVEADFSDLAKKLAESPDSEDEDLEIENAFSDGTILKELDGPIWDYLRHKYDNLAGSGVEVEVKPNSVKDLTNKTKFVFKVSVSYDPPNIDESELAAKFKEAFRGVAG
jgi:hypothetical protein